MKLHIVSVNVGKPVTVEYKGKPLQTVMGLLESEVYIGDVYQVGGAVLQVSQPRYPCFKLVQKHGVTNLPARVIETGYSGFYLRVLQEGHLSVASTIDKLESHPAQLTIAEVLQLMAHGRDDGQYELLKKAAELDVLATGLRQRFQSWLDM